MKLRLFGKVQAQIHHLMEVKLVSFYFPFVFFRVLVLFLLSNQQFQLQVFKALNHLLEFMFFINLKTKNHQFNGLGMVFFSFLFSRFLVLVDLFSLVQFSQHQFQLSIYEDLNHFFLRPFFVKVQDYQSSFMHLELSKVMLAQERHSISLELLQEIQAKEHQFISLSLVQVMLAHYLHSIMVE